MLGACSLLPTETAVVPGASRPALRARTRKGRQRLLEADSPPPCSGLPTCFGKSHDSSGRNRIVTVISRVSCAWITSLWASQPPFMNNEKRAGCHKFILHRYLRAGVAGIKWNGRPISNRIGGRIHVERVAGLDWNTQARRGMGKMLDCKTW